jgi:hypothetical protein
MFFRSAWRYSEDYENWKLNRKVSSLLHSPFAMPGTRTEAPPIGKLIACLRTNEFIFYLIFSQFKKMLIKICKNLGETFATKFSLLAILSNLLSNWPFAFKLILFMWIQPKNPYDISKRILALKKHWEV